MLIYMCRFHPLSEFDEGKRSCRRRLAGHNRRRRKTQPEDVMSRPESGAAPGNVEIFNLLSAIASSQGEKPIDILFLICAINQAKVCL